MQSEPKQNHHIYHHVKRAADLLMAAVSILLLSPLFLLCYIAVRCEDGGPALFRQERIGRHGIPFTMYKFRSMRMDAEVSGPQLYTHGGDKRLTKIGRFLRAHHLDELPQLWNILKGDMTFVGPRPEREFYIKQIMQHDSRYPLLYDLRPGVTSHATLYNGYTDTMEKMLRRLEMDLDYLEHQSLLLDTKILYATFVKMALGKKF